MIWRDKWADSFQWHPWFAWRPINVDSRRVWLESIWRKRKCLSLEMRLMVGPIAYGHTWFVYRLAPPNSTSNVTVLRPTKESA